MSNTGHDAGNTTSAEPTDFDWPNRGHELITTSVVMTVFCTLVTVWRVAVRFRVSPWLGVSDWLMIGGVVSSARSQSGIQLIRREQALNFVANIPFIIFAANGGQGRLMADPWWLIPGNTEYELHMIFITQCLNVYGMFLVKASICAYLMALNFGPSYRILIWVSVVIVVLINFVMMVILHFAFCRPYYSRWDFSVKQECWPAAVSEGTAYAQIAANVITDLVSAWKFTN